MNRAKPVSWQPVPFVLPYQPTGTGAWGYTERREKESRSLWAVITMLGLIGVIPAIGLLAGSFNGTPTLRTKAILLLSLLVAVTALCILLWIKRHDNARILSCSADGRRVFLQAFQSGSRTELVEAHLETIRVVGCRARLRIHPYWPLTWHGNAVCVLVGSDRFVLACDKSDDLMERVRVQAPPWLRQCIWEHGEDLTGVASALIGPRKSRG